VTAGQAARIETPGAKRVGVFVGQGPAEIAATMAAARLDLAQLHGDHGPEAAEAAGPERVIKVFWPERQRLPGAGPPLAEELELWRPWAKWYLFDAGVAIGGHGRKLAADFQSPVPYLLAGGLAADDVCALWPASDNMLLGFDLSSSLESAPGRKDPEAIKALFRRLASLAPGAQAGR
jgi:phosphoribosylanthranilate isomerase